MVWDIYLKTRRKTFEISNKFGSHSTPRKAWCGATRKVCPSMRGKRRIVRYMYRWKAMFSCSVLLIDYENGKLKNTITISLHFEERKSTSCYVDFCPCMRHDNTSRYNLTSCYMRFVIKPQL